MAKRIAIIGFDNLSIIGIKTILLEIGEYVCNIFESENRKFQSDSFLLYIVSPNILLKHLDFFLPRKNKVLLIVSDTTTEEKYPVRSVSVNDEVEKLKLSIKNILSNSKEITKEHKLSSRELDVLKEIAKGKINKEIADTLNISINTVITHRKNLSSKLGIRTASGLSLYAIMNGII